MKEKLTNNLGLKIVSVIIAAILWFTIMNISEPVSSAAFYDIPVKIINDEVITSKGYQYSIESGESITIKVRGRRKIVDSLEQDKFEAVADFYTLNSMNLVAIEVTYPGYTENDLEITARTEHMAIRPEESASQFFAIRTELVGEVPEGYTAFDATAIPGLVEAVASKTQMENIKELVAQIDCTGRTESFDTVAKLVAYDTNGAVVDSNKLTLSQESVTISVEILPVKDVNIKLEATGDAAKGYFVSTIDYAPTTIKIAARQALLKNLDEMVVKIDVTDIYFDTERTINAQEYVSLYLGDEYHVIGDEMIYVKVGVSFLDRKRIDLEEDDIEVRNLAPGLSVVEYVTTPMIGVRGEQEDLDAIKPEDLKLYIDLADCGEGTHSKLLQNEYEGDLLVESSSVLVVVGKK